MKKQLLYLGLLLPFQLLAQIAEPQFVTPIQGAHLQDYYLVNYVDWSLDNIEDFQCGHKTYDGHQGTDFTLRNFAQMDTGVEVYAANDGVITGGTERLAGGLPRMTGLTAAMLQQNQWAVRGPPTVAGQTDTTDTRPAMHGIRRTG